MVSETRIKTEKRSGYAKLLPNILALDRRRYLHNVFRGTFIEESKKYLRYFPLRGIEVASVAIEGSILKVKVHVHANFNWALYRSYVHAQLCIV